MLRSAVRLGLGSAAVATGGWVLRALHGASAALGASPMEIRAVCRRSPNYRGGVFVNIDPTSVFELDRERGWLLLREVIDGRVTSRPPAPIPLATPVPVTGGPTDLAVSWFGHSTTLVEIDGYRVLSDPVWSTRCSPSGAIGPRRTHPVPTPLETLPAIDAVVISHDHYDHLDFDTVVTLARIQRAPFVVPLGVGAHLRSWGIDEARIVELDWGESYRLAKLTLTCSPARHFSGRFRQRNNTLWASWVLTGPGHRVYFGGDTGYTTSFARIGAEHGPFDLTLMPIGAYNSAWPDIHMTPEEAVRAHLDVTDSRSGLLVPIHWCTFRLAPHPWAEPVERLLAAAATAHVRVAAPKPGGRVDAAEPGTFDPWWRRECAAGSKPARLTAPPGGADTHQSPGGRSAGAPPPRTAVEECRADAPLPDAPRGKPGAVTGRDERMGIADTRHWEARHSEGIDSVIDTADTSADDRCDTIDTTPAAEPAVDDGLRIDRQN
ncbi:MBL fold metallo-hydrolase [Mycobacterium sp. SM1]|nr:MBL fold metallo-hydrolase [Mycobacterium sp. SM1]